MGLLQGAWQIVNVMPGVARVVVAAKELVEYLRRWMARRAFRQVLGNDIDAKFYLIYAEHQAPAHIMFGKPRSAVRRTCADTTNLTLITSSASARAVSHLAYAIGNFAKRPPLIRSDNELDARFDVSFASLGGVNNRKTCDLLNEAGEASITFEGDCIKATKDGRVLFRADAQFDGAVIMKLQPKSSPGRTWICCAGIGEWGTSGAAWYLAQHWKDIREFAGGKPFRCVTKTRKGGDEDTRVVQQSVTECQVDPMAASTAK